MCNHQETDFQQLKWSHFYCFYMVTYSLISNAWEVAWSNVPICWVNFTCENSCQLHCWRSCISSLLHVACLLTWLIISTVPEDVCYNLPTTGQCSLGLKYRNVLCLLRFWLVTLNFSFTLSFSFLNFKTSSSFRCLSAPNLMTGSINLVTLGHAWTNWQLTGVFAHFCSLTSVCVLS